MKARDRAAARRGWLALIVALVVSAWLTGFTPDKFRDMGNAIVFVRGMFPPDWRVLPEVLAAMADTLAIAFLGTLIAFVLAFPASFIAARNIGPGWLGAAMRGLLACFRSVPPILWALLFLVGTSLGDVAGVMALAAHNLGILGKLLAEVYETAPPGPQEAVATTGAPRSAVVWFGILPWAMPTVLSHTFFRFECNIRDATILGIVGAGGIGKLLMIHRQLFNYGGLLVDTAAILVLVLLADALGALVRRQVT